MAARNKPYDQFGPYILFKKLESDALGDLWRAGRIDNGQLGPTVALRRLSGGNRPALVANAEAAAELLPQLHGASFARDQVVGVIDGVPYITYSYAGGRSLRHIVDRARGGNGAQATPLPIDQAIVIAEKVALSLATMSELRDGTGMRLWHGALIPQFIWISDDGEIRVAGQQMGSGLMSSLGDAKVSAEVGRYFSPESRTSTQQAAKNADVYSLGAILFLLVTGVEPPDAATASAFASAVRAAKTMTGAPIPDDIRVILDKSFNIDPSMRYATIADMKQAVSALAHGGKYSASTFNLAFYLSNLLKKEMESEAIDREKEAKVNVAPYLEAPRTSAPVHTPAPAMFAAAEQQAAAPKSKMPLALAAGLIVAGGIALGTWMMLKDRPEQPVSQVATAQTISAPVKPRVISEPIVATPQTSTAPATATTDTADPEAQKRIFEEAVRQKLQAEMMKLQSDFMTELKQKQSKVAPIATTPSSAQNEAPAPAEDRTAIAAAELDSQRREAAARQQEQLAAQNNPAPAVTQTQAPAPVPQQQPANNPAPAVVAAAVREGDVIDVGDLDVVPKPLRPIAVVYPPIARQQKIAATIVVTAFVNEKGEVKDVRVLRGDARFGLNDAAVRAMRATKFSPGMKDGKRVQTWFPQTITFQP